MSGTAYAPEWLDLRESADADARADELLDLLIPSLRGRPPVIRDLGCGTGSMGRWLAARLPGPAHWILHDRDPVLLARAVAGMPRSGGQVMAAPGDITGLHAANLAGTSLVTASALLDLLTADEVTRLAEACARARCPALLALSVVGRVLFSPADPLDAELAGAFNDHQRRTSDGRRLLGPDAVDVTVAAFQRFGVAVHRRPSPWRLGPEQAALTARWLRDWVAAAVEQRPELASRADAYLRRRLDDCASGRLRVVIGHADLLALPGSAP